MEWWLKGQGQPFLLFVLSLLGQSVARRAALTLPPVCIWVPWLLISRTLTGSPLLVLPDTAGAYLNKEAGLVERVRPVGIHHPPWE